jgi:hypothetical protein
MVNKKLLSVNLLAVLVFVCLSLCAPAAGAQADDPTPECTVVSDDQLLCLSSISTTLTPFVPTAMATPLPIATATVTPTPTEIIMLPWKQFAYLPLVVAADIVTGDVN